MEKILVGFASFASLAAIGTVLVVVPYLYNAINEVHDEVMDSVQVGHLLKFSSPSRSSVLRRMQLGRRRWTCK